MSVLTEALTISKFDASLSIEKITLEKATVNLYSVAADLATKEPALDEYEIVLSEAPKTNVFTLPFTMQEVEFGPEQLPLNQELNLKDYDSVSETEAWKNGELVVYRPENIVNSYPLYHKSKTGNIYGTGKIGHLMRSESIDAKGWRVWNQTKIGTGNIIITVPQDFLDKAVYPVVVDPTFGYTSIGASSGNGNNLLGCKFSLTENGSVTAISIYIASGGSAANIEFGIYDSSKNKKFGETTGVARPVDDWATISGLSVSLSAGDYYLCAYSDNYNAKYDAGGAAQSFWGGTAWNDPIVPGGNIDWKISIHADYTVTSTYSPKTRSSLPSTMVAMLNSKILFG
jgi:hypothetical protein